MKMKKLLTILLAASIVAGSAQVPGLTMQVQAAQVQTQESAGSATATYNGKTFNRASAAYHLISPKHGESSSAFHTFFTFYPRAISSQARNYTYF